MRRVGALLSHFAGWVIRTYGLWAARHEPYSFAIYPAIAAIVPLIWWFAIGHTAALVLLAIIEALIVFFLGWLFRRRRRLFRERW